MPTNKDVCEKDKPCETCSAADKCTQEEKERHEERRLKETLFHIRHKLMVMSGKGGVGKTTVAVNLAAALAMEGHRVGLLDADIHGPNVPRMLGLDFHWVEGSKEGLRPVEAFPDLKVISMALISRNPDSPIVWRGPIKHNVIKQFLSDVQWGDLDFLVVDLPPGTGDEPLSVAHLIGQVDGSIIVTTPQDVALLDSRKAVGFSRLLHIPVLGIVENMSGLVCPHCSREIPLFKVGGGEKAAQELKVDFLGRIPIEPDMVECCDNGRPLVIAKPYSRAKKAYQELASAVMAKLAQVSPTTSARLGP